MTAILERVERFEKLIKEMGYENRNDFCRKSKIDPSQLGKELRRTKRLGDNMKTKVINKLGLTKKRLLIILEKPEETIPIVAWMPLSSEFSYQAANQPGDELPRVPSPEADLAENELYGIEVVGPTSITGLTNGSILFAKRNSYNEVKEGGLAVYVKESGMAAIRQVHFEGDLIKLKNVVTGVEDTINRKHISSLDRIAYTKY